MISIRNISEGRYFMKKGISYWTFKGKSYKEAFELAKKHGFDGVEVTLDPEGEITLDTTDEEISAIGELAKEYGIEFYSVATGLHWSYPLTSNDKTVREKAKQIVCREIEIASILGCDSVLVVPGMVSEETPYDVAYDRALDAMRELSAVAEGYGVIIGVENVWNKFLLSPLEYKNFIDEVNSPYVKAYFDVGNVVYDGYPEQWIKILGSRIAKIHFKDYVRDNRTLSGFVDICDGDINFKKVMCALSCAGYDDFCTAEIFPEGDVEACVSKIKDAYDKIF